MSLSSSSACFRPSSFSLAFVPVMFASFTVYSSSQIKDLQVNEKKPHTQGNITQFARTSLKVASNSNWGTGEQEGGESESNA